MAKPVIPFLVPKNSKSGCLPCAERRGFALLFDCSRCRSRIIDHHSLMVLIVYWFLHVFAIYEFHIFSWFSPAAVLAKKFEGVVWRHVWHKVGLQYQLWASYPTVQVAIFERLSFLWGCWCYCLNFQFTLNVQFLFTNVHVSGHTEIWIHQTCCECLQESPLTKKNFRPSHLPALREESWRMGCPFCVRTC